MQFIQLPAENVRARGLQVPAGVDRSGIYLLTFENGERYLGQTNDVVVRIGGHARSYDDIAAIAFCPVPHADLETAYRDVESRVGQTTRTRLEISSATGSPGGPTPRPDPYLERVRWIEMNLSGLDIDRPAAISGQRERTRPHFDRLAAHAEFELLRRMVSLYLHRVIPGPGATELRNWVITAMPSTARTRVWHRLICLSVNNVEALTVGEQFDGERWSVAGFISAAWTDQSSRSVLPVAARRLGAFVAPTYYKTVGDVSQIGFDSLAALGPLLDSDKVLDLAGELMMRLMKRGRGMYGRFHDYNLADAVLDPGTALHLLQWAGNGPDRQSIDDTDSAGREGFEPSDAL